MTSAPLSTIASVDFDADPLTDETLPDGLVDFLAALHSSFEPTRQLLLESHRATAAALRSGARPEFDPSTRHVRASDWHVAPAPPDLTNRRTELTSPVNRAAMIEAMASGANVFMADFEDTISPTWHNCLDGQRNLREAYAGTLPTAAHAKQASAPALVVRTRGWHLDETHFRVDGQAISGSLFDFGVCVYHNAATALGAGSGPYFYLPKFEGAADARLWRDVFGWTENRLGLEHGSIRATVLIETISAAFQMDEILFELRDHITGLHTGNWDYLFSMVKSFADDPSFVLPDRADLSATTPFIRAFTELLVSTCHRRGAHAIGGMSGIIPDLDDPDRTADAVRKVTVDKRREAGDGFDGTRLAHPSIVAIAAKEFERVLSYRPNQVEIQRDDVYVTAGDLLAVASARGQRTAAGLRRNVRYALHYLGHWLAGSGAVVIDDHLEDTAMAELCRVQIWQWRHHRVELENGRVVDDAFLERIFAEEYADLEQQLGPHAWASGQFRLALEVLRDMTFTDDLVDFIPRATADHL